jgi:hypothetical protein
MDDLMFEEFIVENQNSLKYFLITALNFLADHDKFKYEYSLQLFYKNGLKNLFFDLINKGYYN